MVRLLNRVGVFRVLSIGVLTAGLGGAALVAERQTDDHLASTSTAASLDSDDVRALEQELVDQQNAQRKADQAAAVDAERAKTAEDAARQKPDTASRSDARATPSAKPSNKLIDPGEIPESCSTYTGNRAIGCKVTLESGFDLSQMACLDKLFNKESHWSTTAKNPSGAYGIPQALPGSKMGPGWESDPVVQIRWGLSYIKQRYSTPCGAWGHSQSSGWY